LFFFFYKETLSYFIIVIKCLAISVEAIKAIAGLEGILEDSKIIQVLNFNWLVFGFLENSVSESLKGELAFDEKMNSAKSAWPVDSEEKEDDSELPIRDAFSDDEVLTHSEAKVEHMLASKLTLDAVDMGALPRGMDYEAWTHVNSTSKTYHTSSGGDRSTEEEKRPSNLSAIGKPIFLDEVAFSHSPSPPSARTRRTSALGMHRLRTSPSSERLDEMSSVYSPRTEYSRRSSNLSQVIMKKSPSVECLKSLGRDDHAHSPPPPPPSTDHVNHSLGPRRSSNLTVMRLIAETI
jgi:hypothetical protein